MEFRMNLLIILVCFIFAASNCSRLSTYSTTNGITTTKFTFWSPTTTSEINSTTSSTTASTSTTTTQDPLGMEVETTTTTSTTTLPPITKIAEPAGEHGNNKNSDKSSDENTNYIISVACIVGGIIGLIIIVAAICLIRRCLKKRATGKPTPSETAPPQIDASKTETTDFKKIETNVQTPPTATNPMAPEHIAAETFAYKGPLVLQTKPPTEIPLVHELDNDRPQSIHDSHHIIFDDALNEVHEIGSDVEIFMDGEKKLPKKARSSLPSPYGEPTKQSGGGKKKKISEKQKDKAIRE
uniref:Uncharacterized protein n=1 Tax=Panagrolaimus sp. ES5 TaxID=591445 RepID=A0AC34G058_9BILA